MVGLSRSWRATCIAIAAIGVVVALPAPVSALITAPVTVAGPASDVVEFGGVAMAPDGSGGVVYTKAVDGVRHVYANRYLNGSWSAPMRVDADVPYEASQPRIAAGRGGELLVVWVSETATVKQKPRFGLYSARIERGSESFSPFLLVDPDVREGIGVDPSLSATATSQAIVAYRVITYTFDGSEPSTAVQLRPGDVMAEIRVARLKEDRWSRMGSVNNNLGASMRPPSATNGPKVGAGVDGNAVVAWQEPDQSGAARIYLRRIFGTVLGNVLPASPLSADGGQVTGDVDAFSLAVTPFNQARVAMRLLPNSSAGRVRLLLNTLPAGFQVPANAMRGVVPVFTADSAQPASIGSPGVAAYEKGGSEGRLRLAYVAGGQIRQTGVDASGGLAPIAVAESPAALAGSEAVATVDPAGGGAIAYPASGPNGAETLAVRQEFAKGGAQSGFVSGVQSGPIANLRLAGSGSGDALIGFRQGEPGAFQIVVERLTAPPATFKVKGPKGWAKPNAVSLRWEPAQSAAAPVRYSVLLDGRFVKRNLRQRRLRLRPGQLGSGRPQAKVLATDRFGQQVLSRAVKLRVDGQPPVVRLGGPSGAAVSVRVRDGESGLAAKKTRIDFGDGTREAGGSRFSHRYERRGCFTVTVRARDRVGNRIVRGFEVRVG